MSHHIRYLTYHCSTSEKAILKDLNRFAFDPEETSGYHGNLKFHKEPVYKTRDEAIAATGAPLVWIKDFEVADNEQLII